MCYECSLEIWNGSNECYLCRKVINIFAIVLIQYQPITQVLQLDLKNFGKCKVIKVISSTQMITCENDEDKEFDDLANSQMIY